MLLGGAATAWPLAAEAQQGGRVRRIGVLMPTDADNPDNQARLAAFLQGLQQLGWAVGHNLLHTFVRFRVEPGEQRSETYMVISAVSPASKMPSPSQARLALSSSQ